MLEAASMVFDSFFLKKKKNKEKNQLLMFIGFFLAQQEITPAPLSTQTHSTTQSL